MMLILFLLLGIFVSGVHSSGYYFVIAPNVLRFDQDETVVVSVFGESNAHVKVWLEYKGKQFSSKDVTVKDQETPNCTTVKVTEDDIFDAMVQNKPRKVKLLSEWNGSQQSREIILSYHTGYLIVQTDKPMYTPLQKVKIRALALDESLKGVDGWPVGMDIISPSGLTLGRKWRNNSDTGFFENDFGLPPYPELGIWTSRAFYGGQFETEAHALFEVREYVLPTFGVTVDVDVEFLLDSTESITVKVTAKYVYGKPVEGNARLMLKLKGENGESDFILNTDRKTLEKSNFEGSVTEFNIKVGDILNSPLLKDKPFPLNKSLDVIAMVYESATGKEEVRRHDTTIFTMNPYVFKFTKSKLNFWPDYEYHLKVEVQYVNGKPATDKDLLVRMSENGQLKKEQVTKINDGQATSIFKTTQGMNKISFTVSTSDKQYESSEFEVVALPGKNKIQVECVTEKKVMLLRAFTNIQGNSYTGMLFVVVSRGKVVYTKYKGAGKTASEAMTNDLQELVSPDARLLVFYVDKTTNELVTDSIKFEVEKKCRGKGLKLETMKKEVAPVTNDRLTVTGTPFMHVGLNIMDKAFLLLNDKNVLRKNKMFETLQSHDLGCGEGSGRSGADVFKKSGLTVLTNAAVDENDIIRTIDGCQANTRKRRDSDSCLDGAAETCCEEGYKFAETLFYEADNPARMNPYTSCYPKALELTKENKLSIKCVMAFFKSCIDEFEYRITDKTSIISKFLDDEVDYMDDIAQLKAYGIRNTPRKEFPESWLFKVLTLNRQGQTMAVLKVPDSITEWSIQAIGITKDEGMCIADPIDLKAFRDFFIQLDLPYKASRLEHLNVKATIFNYGMPGDDKKMANVYLQGVPHLCYNNDPGKPSPRVKVELPPNSAQTVTFPMIPLKAGLFPVKVSAFVMEGTVPVIDVIEKNLYVVNEGIEEKIIIVLCLDPMEQNDACKHDERVVKDIKHGVDEREYVIDLTLPENSISQTGSATGYIQSSLMTNIVNTIIDGVDSLFSKPAGCGEQTMIRLAPTVYAMTYLKQTKQQNANIETKGNQWIRDGVNREVSQYRQSDGSYAAWRYRTPSTWLTAFVAKVFCQAKKVVNDAVDQEEDIKLTIDWLNNHVEADGSFIDKMPVIHREMIGQINESDHTLTAFVLITLQECSHRSVRASAIVNKTMQFLESLSEKTLKNNPYLLAISTYALALSNSNRTSGFMGYLHDIKKNDREGTFWGNPGSKPANANSIETTAYALLALLKFGDIKTSSSIVSWLTSHRDATGSFRTTQDTVVGLQALSQYNIVTYSPDVKLAATFYLTSEGKEIDITSKNAIEQIIVRKLPVETKDNKLIIKVKGSGSAVMSIDLRYNRPATEEETCPFTITDIDVQDAEDLQIDTNLAKERNCDVCGHCDVGDNDYDDNDSDNFGDKQEIDSKIKSNFGRKKRETLNRATAKKKCIRFSVSSKNDKTYGMSIVKFGLETGVEVIKSDIEKLVKENNTNIANYEMPSGGKGFIVFYVHEISSKETKFIFRLKDKFDGEESSRQPSSVYVYDYYNPDKHCTKLYGTGPYMDKTVSYQCKKSAKECTCFQSMCAQQLKKDEIEKMAKTKDKKRKPALLLFKYACNTDKANYAVRVKINEVTYDARKHEKIAIGTVIHSINRGIEPLEPGDEMQFFWKFSCDLPAIKEEKTYIIIGRDGYKSNSFDEEREIYRYPLMGTTRIMECASPQQLKRHKKTFRILNMVQLNFERMMKKHGCQN